MSLSLYVESLFQPPDTSYWWSLYPFVSIPFIFVVWLAALLPLYLRVLAGSTLWHWPVCTFCGVAAGTFISLVVWSVLDPFGLSQRFLDFLMASLRLGGVCGGATCLFGSLTVPLFRGQWRFRSHLLPRKAMGQFREKLDDLSGQ